MNNPFSSEAESYIGDGSKFKLGIVIEKYQYHKSFVAACREMGVSYVLLDLFRDDWIKTFNCSGCDAFMIWPSPNLTVWKDMFDDRVRILSEELNSIIFPSMTELWLYENKRRQRDWMLANNIPHPKSWVFYDEDEALDFAESAKLPIIYKINIGASGSGVWLLKSKSELKKFIRETFRTGVTARRRNPNDKQWRTVYLQEYIDVTKEWRMVRIGDSFFGHVKGKKGDFHSGSGVVVWDVPTEEHLEFLLKVTQKGDFKSMDVDMFETSKGELLVNELQTVFGASHSVDQMRVNDKPARFVNSKGNWNLEYGDFARNACANARVDYLINHILLNRESNRKD